MNSYTSNNNKEDDNHTNHINYTYYRLLHDVAAVFTKAELHELKIITLVSQFVFNLISTILMVDVVTSLSG